MWDAIPRSHINELQQTKQSAIRTYANISRVDRFRPFFVKLISFILERKRSIALSVRQRFSPSPQPGILKVITPSIYANIIFSFEMVERQS